MSGNNPEETPKYLWYQVGNWTDLEQGDLLPNCPVLVPSADITDQLISAKEGDRLELPSKIQFADLIIMSQTCDLVQSKIEQVLLCAYHPAEAFGGKDKRASIRKEQRPPLHMIESCDLEGFEFKQQVVDFRTIYTLPKDFIFKFASQLDRRVRLLSPYKEHLSQAFARYFMRVGLPRPLKEE